jgi:hypothetical protein
MKKLAILSAIALSGLIYNTADAQLRIHLGLNFGVRPVVYQQAPVVVQEQPVYDDQPVVYNDSNDDDYYYLPDVNAYYDVNQECYYYNDGDNWISAVYLPGSYRNYDWRSGRRYEIRGNRPYMHNDVYMSRYNGREIAEWRHFNHDNRYGGGYRNDDHFNRDAYRGNDNHFNNRFGFGRPDVNRDNHDHFDNRGNNNRNWNNNQDQNRGNDNHNRDNRGFGQPSNQNNGGQNRDNRGGGGNEHFAQNNPQGGFAGHRMARF